MDIYSERRISLNAFCFSIFLKINCILFGKHYNPKAQGLVIRMDPQLILNYPERIYENWPKTQTTVTMELRVNPTRNSQTEQ